MNAMANCLVNICKRVFSIVSSEKRLLEIAAPCYILGSFFVGGFLKIDLIIICLI
jgi:hypothetical protein